MIPIDVSGSRLPVGSLERHFRAAWADPDFKARYNAVLADYAGRPSALTECHNLSERLGLRGLLKREDLNHTGSHKINNVIGQGLLTLRMGKTPARGRDRGGPARGGERHGSCAVRPGVRCLYGRG